MLSQKSRISNPRLIDKLNKEGKAFKTSHFVFKYLPSQFGESKFAAVVSKKIAPKAFDRNRLRRQIAESLRLNMNELERSIVCLAILKKGSPEAMDYNVIDAQIKELINQFSADV